MDKTKAVTVSADLKRAVEEVLAKHGLILEPKWRVKYGAREFRVTVEAAELTAGGAEELAAIRFAEDAAPLGLVPSDRGRQFVAGGRIYEVESIRLGRRRPIIARRVADGKLFQFETGLVKSALTPKAGAR